jgi:hypothetical protein
LISLPNDVVLRMLNRIVWLFWRRIGASLVFHFNIAQQ